RSTEGNGWRRQFGVVLAVDHRVARDDLAADFGRIENDILKADAGRLQELLQLAISKRNRARLTTVQPEDRQEGQRDDDEDQDIAEPGGGTLFTSFHRSVLRKGRGFSSCATEHHCHDSPDSCYSTSLLKCGQLGDRSAVAERAEKLRMVFLTRIAGAGCRRALAEPCTRTWRAGRFRD